MNKIWKVYSQCVTRPKGKAIIEISEKDLNDEKFDLMNEIIDHETDLSFLCDDDGEIDDKLEKLHREAILKLIDEYWNWHELLDCGDYEIILSDDMPSRPNMAGYTNFDTDEIKSKMKELDEKINI